MAIANSPNATRARRAVRETRPSSAPRSRLAVVSARKLQQRAQRRRARVIALLAAGFVVVGLLVVVTGQALVASQQLHLDNLQSQLATATATNENLELRRAQLTAPTTVLQIAEHHLHMVSPASVTYLSPVNPGTTVSQAAAGKK
jgi:hypothetical protein